jgi:hypothetical protein
MAATMISSASGVLALLDEPEEELQVNWIRPWISVEQRQTAPIAVLVDQGRGRFIAVKPSPKPRFCICLRFHHTFATM